MSHRRDYRSPAADSRSLRIGYVSTEYLDPSDVRAWSGLAYFIAQALEKHGAEVIPIPLRDGWRKAAVWARFLFFRFVRGQRYLRDRDPGLLRSYARQIEEQCRHVRPDLLFCPGTAPLAFVDGRIPSVFWSDGTFGAMRDFYPSYTNLAACSVRAGEAADAAALGSCALALYSSDWAADHARQAYRPDPAKVHVIPFGANLLEPPTAESVSESISARTRDCCRLLFAGVEWDRKGADRAIALVAALRSRGVDAVLDIVGCDAPAGRHLPEGVRAHGFVSKATAEGRARIDHLFRASHFFVLPTRAEAYGLVFCEAAAFGLPVLATRVGGIGTIVRQDVTGALFDIDSPADVYADWLVPLWQDRPRYENMARAARAEYESRLNWEAATRRVVSLMRAVAADSPSAAQVSRE